jgi:protease I
VINPDKLRLHEKAIDFIREFGRTGRPLAAICHGPWTLINAGLVRGKHMTSWPSLRVDLENAGAEREDREVVESGHLITSRKPDDIPAFTQALIRALQEHKAEAA